MKERFRQDKDGTIFREVYTGVKWLPWFIVEGFRNEAELNIYLHKRGNDYPVTNEEDIE